MRRWIRAVVVVAALGSTALGLTALQVSRDAAGAAPTPFTGPTVEVGVIGDSLTVGSTASITNGLAALGLSARIDAVNGRSITGGVTALQSMRASSFDSLIWVIALGTNDVWWNAGCNCGITLAAATNLIERMLDAIGPGRHVYWVNVNRTDITPATQVFNQALTQVALNRADLRIVDWFGLSSANPSWFAADGVHFSGTGYSRRGAQIADAVAASPVAQANQTLPTQVGLVGTDRAGGSVAQRGDRGSQVRAVQEALAARDLLAASAVDGIFGAGTESAVRTFQESIGLRPTGIVTAKTAHGLGLAPGTP